MILGNLSNKQDFELHELTKFVVLLFIAVINTGMTPNSGFVRSYELINIFKLYMICLFKYL